MGYSVVCAYHIQMRFSVIFFKFIYRSVEHFVLAPKLIPHSIIRVDYQLWFFFFNSNYLLIFTGNFNLHKWTINPLEALIRSLLLVLLPRFKFSHLILSSTLGFIQTSGPHLYRLLGIFKYRVYVRYLPTWFWVSFLCTFYLHLCCLLMAF